MHAHTSVLRVLKLHIGPKTKIFSSINVTLEDFSSSTRHSKVLRSSRQYYTALVIKIKLNTLSRQYIPWHLILHHLQNIWAQTEP